MHSAVPVAGDFLSWQSKKHRYGITRNIFLEINRAQAAQLILSTDLKMGQANVNPVIKNN